MENNSISVNGQSALTPSKRDYSAEVSFILNAARISGGKFGLRSLSAALKGSRFVESKLPPESKEAYFACLTEMSSGDIRNLILFLIKKEYLRVVSNYQLVQISEQGEAWLLEPKAMVLSPQQFRFNKMRYKLLNTLLELRKAIATEKNCAPFEVFQDYTLYQMVDRLPADSQQMMDIHGIGPKKTEEFGGLFLKAILEYNDKAEAYKQAKIKAYSIGKVVQKPTYQETKTLFLEGKTPDEIAALKQVKLTTVQNYLERLHLSGEIDLKPWIEKQLDKKSLHRGAKFFRETMDARLKTAHEVLGLDYETLRFCRLYAGQKAGSTLAA